MGSRCLGLWGPYGRIVQLIVEICMGLNSDWAKNQERTEYTLADIDFQIRNWFRCTLLGTGAETVTLILHDCRGSAFASVLIEDLSTETPIESILLGTSNGNGVADLVAAQIGNTTAEKQANLIRRISYITFKDPSASSVKVGVGAVVTSDTNAIPRTYGSVVVPAEMVCVDGLTTFEVEAI